MSEKIVLPNVALTIKQPWASLIIQGGKDIENRSWKTKFRGRVLIHASKKLDRKELESAADLIFTKSIDVAIATRESYFGGGIIGVADIVDCVEESESKWFCGPFGFVLANVRPLPFFACRGALGFWKCEYPKGYVDMLETEGV